MVAGTLALVGGRAFERVGANEAIHRRLLAAAGAPALVLPTADAFEHPERLVGAAVAWFAGLGGAAEGLMVLNRRDALDERNVEAVRSARFVYLVGDSPLHLRSVMKATPLWEAVTDVLARGGVVAAGGASAACVCDPMTDPRGGAFTLGLGLVRPLAIVNEAETWSHDRLHRTRQLATNFPIATLPSGTALVRSGDAWEIVGDDVEVTGELPGS
jgi:cyanophycinase